MHIMDKLYARISELKNPTVAGLDTRIEYLPEEFIKEILPEGIKSFEDAAEAVYQYNVRLVDALYDIVPSVKVQVAYYEMYGVAGMAAFETRNPWLCRRQEKLYGSERILRFFGRFLPLAEIR